MKKSSGTRPVAVNRKARHDYEILETCEAGIALLGTEIKSIRDGKINLKDGFASLESQEIYLHNVHISPYTQANRQNHDPTRPRKLLLHRHEIKRLIGKVQERGLTLIPLKVYFVRGKAKVQLGLAKGKKDYDRREDLKRRTAERDMEKAFQSYQKGKE